MKMLPLQPTEYKMKLLQDLGMQKATTTSKRLVRFALFECPICLQPFKALATSKAAKNQTSCYACTLNPKQTCKHPLYAIWNGIKQRCYSSKRKDYARYGGVGVTMCDEWKNNPQQFIDWCLLNGWESSLVVDKDIKCAELGISPAIYAPNTISFITMQMNAEQANAKVVLQYALSGELIAEHDSCVKAATSVGFPKGKSNVANCCRGLAHTAFGFVWKYKEGPCS